MAVQDEVTWVLETIRDNWPAPADTGTYGEGTYGDGLYYSDDGFGEDEDVYRVNRDDPKVLETGERTRSVELTRASALGASLGSRTPEVAGPDNRRRVTTTVDCRFKAATSRGGERGHVESDNDAKRIALYAKNALQQAQSYPDVDPDADEIGRVAYHSLFVDSPENSSREYMDEYLWTWTVRLVGYETI